MNDDWVHHALDLRILSTCNEHSLEELALESNDAIRNAFDCLFVCWVICFLVQNEQKQLFRTS